ncbi:MAG: hypothetical protein ACK4NW_03100 [Roseinatronobacter sp.]
MTEAMSRREIEDVLTSIKRLVSQDIQPRDLDVDAAERSEKLVLTAELRVPEVPEAPDDADSFDSTEHPADTAPPPELTVQSSHAPRDQLQSTDGRPSPSLIRRIAQAGGAPSLGQSQPEPAPAGSETVNILEEAIEDAALEETLARLEAVLSGKPVATPRAPGDATEPPAQDGMALHTPSGDPAEQVIDEGMLYQLVAHIVRQELQGELGEKITRNIRKLVRQEVARELQLRRG